MRSPLHGVRVVELTTMITGPLAGMLLADLGAAVIKIENRGERLGETTAPPATGQDTDEILAELGHSAEAIAGLRDAKVV